MERKVKVLIFALFIWGINNLATGEELALPNKEAVERLVRVEEGQKVLQQGQKTLEQGQKALEKGQKELSDRLTKVEEGQKALEQGQKVLVDRLTKVEEGQKELVVELIKVKEGQIKIEGGQEAINAYLKALDKRIDDLKDLIYVLLAGILALIGFVLWDRRSTISPLTKKAEELDKRNDLLLKILKEYAREEPKMAEVLKSLGLL